jgi:hypothetical protein
MEIAEAARTDAGYGREVHPLSLETRSTRVLSSSNSLERPRNGPAVCSAERDSRLLKTTLVPEDRLGEPRHGEPLGSSVAEVEVNAWGESS